MSRYVDLEALKEEEDEDNSSEGEEEEDEENDSDRDFIVDDDEEEVKKPPKRKPPTKSQKKEKSSSDKTHHKRLRKGPLEEEEEEPVPIKVPVAKVLPDVKAVEFIEDQHKFQLCTNYSEALPILSRIIKMMKSDKESTNVHMVIHADYVRFYSYNVSMTSIVDAHLHKDFFDQYVIGKLQGSRIMILDVTSLASQFARMRNFVAVTGLVLRGMADSLEIKALLPVEQGIPSTFTVKELEGEPQASPDQLVVDYPLAIQLDTKKFAVSVQQMVGDIFMIKIDVDNGCLILASDEGHQKVEIPILLDKIATQAIIQKPKVAQYKASFRKSLCQSVIWGQKLSSMLRLSFTMMEGMMGGGEEPSPLRIQFPIQSPDEREESLVTVYISSLVADGGD